LGARLDNLNQRLAAYLKAESDTLLSQAYKIGTRSQQKALLKDIQEQIKYLEFEIMREQSAEEGHGRNKIIRVIPRDF
jgi:hypothetical protein